MSSYPKGSSAHLYHLASAGSAGLSVGWPRAEEFDAMGMPMGDLRSETWHEHGTI